MPLLWFGIFKEPLNKKVIAQEGIFNIGEWKMEETKQHYQEVFNQIMTAIKQGKTDEINYTVPFKAPFSGNSYTYYKQLQNAQQSAYCAYLSINDFDILSASPELFFQLENNHITVRPMKGTIGRGLTYEQDMKHKTWLANSKKNQYENQLTADLMKQELEAIALKDSITYFDEYRVEKYPTVYQMTTGLSAKVIPDISVMDIFKTLFPCGSIAGVPKQSGIKMIQELEQSPREVYCGAIGYITPKKEAIFNVPIRTVWIDQQNQLAHYGAGGAITKNSVADEEYNEVLTKTEILKLKQPDFSLLETIGLHNGEYRLLHEHLERLKRSAEYFDISLDIQAVKQKLHLIQDRHATEQWRVRLTVEKQGKFTADISPLILDDRIQTIRISESPIDKHNPFFYHKTTFRQIYDVFKAEKETCFDVLLWNDRQEVTEFTIGNIVVELDGELYTPPIACGVLPGTYRNFLIKENVIKERSILLSELGKCTNIWLINSVRGWVSVNMTKDH